MTSLFDKKWRALYSLNIIVDLVPNVFDCRNLLWANPPWGRVHSSWSLLETSNFGSIFNKGVLTTSKPEMDMTYLQGLWREQLQTAVATCYLQLHCYFNNLPFLRSLRKCSCWQGGHSEDIEGMAWRYAKVYHTLYHNSKHAVCNMLSVCTNKCFL